MAINKDDDRRIEMCNAAFGAATNGSFSKPTFVAVDYAAGASGGGITAADLVRMNVQAAGITAASGGGGGSIAVTGESQAVRDAKLAFMREAQLRAKVARREQAFCDQMNKLLGEQKSPFCPPPGTRYGSLSKADWNSTSVSHAKDAPIDRVEDAVIDMSVHPQTQPGLTAKSALPPGKDHAASLAAAVSKAKQKNFGFGQSHITFDRLVQIAVEEYLKQRGLGW